MSKPIRLERPDDAIQTIYDGSEPLRPIRSRAGAMSEGHRMGNGAVVVGDLTVIGLNTVEDYTSLYELLLATLEAAQWAPRAEIVEHLALLAREEMQGEESP